MTEYIFPTTVTLNSHRLLLRPPERHNVRIENSKLDITPAYNIKWQRDMFDNSLAIVSFLAATNKLIIETEVVIQHYEAMPDDFLIEDYAVNFPFTYAVKEQVDLAAFQRPIFVDDQYHMNQWLLKLIRYDMDTFSMLLKLNQCIHQQYPESIPPVSGSFVGPRLIKPALLVNVQVNLLN